MAKITNKKPDPEIVLIREVKAGCIFSVHGYYYMKTNESNWNAILLDSGKLCNISETQLVVILPDAEIVIEE